MSLVIKNLVIKKWIYDNVHGYIGITDIEEEIIDTAIFQRLRHISHLGLASFVYPSATQSRFSHSIGALYVMDKIVTKLVDEEEIEETDRLVLRLVALLHDIGHYPFSHVIERSMSLRYGDKGKHEKLSEYIINNTEIKEKIEKHSLDLKSIVEILLGTSKNRLYTYLVSSDLDVDKIDYLLRDALNTGVVYGFIDFDRLVRTMTVDGSKHRLAIIEKGKQAIENFLIGKYHMSQTVYFHKTVVAFEMMLRRIYEELEKEGKFYGIDQILKLKENDLINFDDHYVWEKMQQYRKENGKNKNIEEMIEMLLKHESIKVSYSDPILTTGYDSPLELLSTSKWMDKLQKESKIDREWIFYSQPREIQLLSGEPEEEIILKREKDEIEIRNDNTSIIFDLARKTYMHPAVYTKKEHVENIKKAIQSVFSDYFALRPIPHNSLANL